MAITNYSDLLTRVAENMARDDLTSYIPDFIMQAEQVFNHGSEAIAPLRIRDMETITSLSPTANVYTLPSDYLQYRRVVEEASPRRALEYIDPTGVDQHYPLRYAGPSNHFTIIGASLYSYPLSSNDVELTYYAAIPALTDSATTNWLITKAPSLYLRMTLMFAPEFVKDNEEVAKQAQMASALIDGMNRSNMMGNYARAGLTIRGNTP